ncbi:MAG: hypothetical protein VKN56_07905 [Cyanobacteriota bacterium]|nr:hypothetical protein [Cyanobacteriota bacterium]
MKLHRAHHRPSPFLLDGIATALLSTTLTVVALWGILWVQKVAQQPAADGIMTVYLDRHGGLRLWNQPIRRQDLNGLVAKAEARTRGSGPLIVRLIPDPQVPWGVIHRMLGLLQPSEPDRSWILQLQLP